VPVPLQRVDVPPQWRRVDFISDLHLHSGDPATVQAWRDYLGHHRADAVFILGDLFEVWLGDDAVTPRGAASEPSFEAQAADTLKAAGRRCPLFFIHGNRDFLVGAALATACGVTLLDDPCLLAFGAESWLLSHGDALCLGDTDYLAFRAEVRSASWQRAFLARPLDERRAIARDLRARSEAHKSMQRVWHDVDAAAARQALRAAGAHTLLHGHTHHPGDHSLGEGLRRIVLSDWDLLAQPPRAQVLRLTLQSDGALPQVQRLSPEAA
jgi:UDP-2,3-diacylglucosamine hydrolase